MRSQWIKIAQTVLLSIGIAALLAACTVSEQPQVSEPPQEQEDNGNMGQTLTVVPLQTVHKLRIQQNIKFRPV
ncbi:hypothetical protein [Paenibacillus sp. 1A_MP2]|uniref:hypothetical protein n=1 Tax=Paenibacillus sp. 1A_MP2 TaxID=3457495 RepID=UPI003FCCCBA6